jgi:hypothetical protein
LTGKKTKLNLEINFFCVEAACERKTKNTFFSITHFHIFPFSGGKANERKKEEKNKFKGKRAVFLLLLFKFSLLSSSYSVFTSEIVETHHRKLFAFVMKRKAFMRLRCEKKSEKSGAKNNKKFELKINFLLIFSSKQKVFPFLIYLNKTFIFPQLIMKASFALEFTFKAFNMTFPSP